MWGGEIYLFDTSDWTILLTNQLIGDWSKDAINQILDLVGEENHTDFHNLSTIYWV